MTTNLALNCTLAQYCTVKGTIRFYGSFNIACRWNELLTPQLIVIENMQKVILHWPLRHHTLNHLKCARRGVGNVKPLVHFFGYHGVAFTNHFQFHSLSSFPPRHFEEQGWRSIGQYLEDEMVNGTGGAGGGTTAAVHPLTTIDFLLCLSVTTKERCTFLSSIAGTGPPSNFNCDKFCNIISGFLVEQILNLQLTFIPSVPAFSQPMQKAGWLASSGPHGFLGRSMKNCFPTWLGALQRQI